MSKKETQLTSVKVEGEKFDSFKIAAIKNKFSLNKLVNRSIDLFLTDEEFRKKVLSHIIKDEE